MIIGLNTALEMERELLNFIEMFDNFVILNSTNRFISIIILLNKCTQTFTPDLDLFMLYTGKHRGLYF